MIRILLLSPQPLLGACLHTLLSQQFDLSVVSLEKNPSYAIERVKELQPDVVIVNGQDTAVAPLVLRLLMDGIISGVIVVNATDNRLRFYRSKEWQLNDVEDLAQAIRAVMV